MDKLLVILQSQQIEFFFDKIFNGLYIMVGYALDLLNTGCVLQTKFLVNFTQRFFVFHCSQIIQLWKILSQSNKILYFDLHSILDKCIF